MKPVHQTVFGESSGNCWSACLASILEVPIEDVPNFCGDPACNENWFSDTDKWLQERGLRIIDVTIIEGSEFGVGGDGIYMIGRGKSPRGNFSHSTVVTVQDGVFAMAHDPHPSGDGLEGKWEYVSFLVRA
jgi:hypothetical protein